MQHQWGWAAAAAVYIALYYSFLSFVESPDLKWLGGTVFALLGPFVASLWLLAAYRRLRTSERWFWLMLFASLLSYVVAELIFRGYTLVRHADPPFPSWPDFFYVGNIVLYLLALLYLIVSKRRYRKMWQALFDSLIVMAVGATFSWVYIIQPLLGAEDVSFFYLVVSMAYPIVDLAVTFLLTILFFSAAPSAKKVLFWNLAGIAIFIIADTIYLIQLMQATYISNSFLDPLWTASLLITGLAGMRARDGVFAMEDGTSERPSLFATFLPYMSLLPLFILVVNPQQRFESMIGFLAVGSLVVLRQVITLRENDALLKQWQHLNRELEQKVAERTKELKNKNEELFYAANHDFLTGLPNRRYFMDALDRAIAEARREEHLLAVLLIDLDRFKQINDYFGHPTGDALLVKMSELLKQQFRSTDLVARQGGDEFTVIVSPVRHIEEIRLLAERLVGLSKQPIAVNHLEMRVSMSIGVTVFPYDGETGDALMKNADMAMYRAKEQGKNQFQFFNGKMDQMVLQKALIESALHHAIERNELKLFYQPQFDLATGEMIGMEALIRWFHPQMGAISPGVFIPIAEETGQIIPIGEWVIGEACRQVKEWNERTKRRLRMSMNISPKQFLQENLVRHVGEVLERTGLPAECVDLEITEGVAVFNEQYTIQKLKQLKQLGVSISIDDFGTGYSSLSYLRKFPIDRLKIAKPFIDGIAQTEEDAAIVTSIIVLAKSLKLRVIAEGVETLQQLHLLRSLRCDEIQGYVLGKPLAKEEFEKTHWKNSLPNE